MAKKQIEVGSKVRLTRKHLRSTGQYAGRNANGSWTVLAIEGSFARVDQILTSEVAAALYSPEELTADPSLAYRRIAIANLEAC